MFRFIFILFVGLLASGCAVTRSEIALSGPPNGPDAAQISLGHRVFVRSVNDMRAFEQAPSDPSFPSLGFEGAAGASADLKARAVGRKRNGYGKALGDVVLKDGTVASLVRQTVESALIRTGFSVVPSTDELHASTLVLDVNVQRFWGWLGIGAWAVSLNTAIELETFIEGRQSPIVFDVSSSKAHAAVTDGAWIKDFNRSLEDLDRKMVSQFSSSLLVETASPEHVPDHDRCVASAIAVSDTDLRTKAIAACGSK